MRLLAFCIAAAVLLCACDVTALAEKEHQQFHRTISAAGIRVVDLKNIAGSIEVAGTGANTISIDATKSGSSMDALARTHIDVESGNGELHIHTTYDQSNEGWFGRSNGGSVAYRLRVPAGIDVQVENVSGSVSLTGLKSSVTASAVSGSVDASLGRVTGNRRVKLSSISGSVGVSVAKNSDVSVAARTISGSISQFMDGQVHKGYAGADSSARLGSGTAVMNLSTVSGSITISPLQP
jgi:DUF4097 and DUF4098 domain-containing protein YvlB